MESEDHFKDEFFGSESPKTWVALLREASDIVKGAAENDGDDGMGYASGILESFVKLAEARINGQEVEQRKKP